MNQRFPFPPHPEGWYFVAMGSQLQPGQVRSLKYFGEDLVLYRTHEGKPVLAGAYCPHLGAHLGCGGKVVGSDLQCPFHGWKFSSTGTCTEVPFSKRIPKRSSLNVRPLVEVNGVLLTYYHPEKSAPTWRIPEIAGCSLNTEPFRWVDQFELKSHIQETNENAEDMAHFPFLHGQHTKKFQSRDFISDGAFAVHRVEAEFGSVFGGLPSLRIPGSTTFTHYGLGLLVAHLEIPRFRGISLENQVCYYSTPIDDERIHFTILMRLKTNLGKLADRAIEALLARSARYTAVQDVPIWANKRYYSKPILSDADGPIIKYRNWAQQFYHSNSSAEARPPAASIHL